MNTNTISKAKLVLLYNDAVQSVQFLSNSEESKQRIIIERFAESIIRECAEICLEDNDHKNILRHFGLR